MDTRRSTRTMERTKLHFRQTTIQRLDRAFGGTQDRKRSNRMPYSLTIAWLGR